MYKNIARNPSKKDTRHPENGFRLGSVSRIGKKAALVAIVRVVVAVPFAGRLTMAGLKLQLAFKGSPVQFAAESVAEPEKPLIDVNVNIVDPDWPGAPMPIAAGLAASEKVVVVTTSIDVASDVDPV
jgi:hypothetical protein